MPHSRLASQAWSGTEQEALAGDGHILPRCNAAQLLSSSRSPQARQPVWGQRARGEAGVLYWACFGSWLFGVGVGNGGQQRE